MSALLRRFYTKIAKRGKVILVKISSLSGRG